MISLIRFTNPSRFSILMKNFKPACSFILNVKSFKTKSQPSSQPPKTPPEFQKFGEELDEKVEEVNTRFEQVDNFEK